MLWQTPLDLVDKFLIGSWAVTLVIAGYPYYKCIGLTSLYLLSIFSRMDNVIATFLSLLLHCATAYDFQALLESRMSESEIIFEEELSVDLFSDVELSQSTNNVANSDCKNPSVRVPSLLTFSLCTNILNL